MQFSFFGAAPDTGNLGVSALCYATLYQLTKYDSNTKVIVFDYGRRCREQRIDFGGDTNLRFRCQGASYSHRYYRSENLQLMQMAGYFGGLGNPGIKTILESDAVIDISGGDSFTDLYEPRRFNSVILPKKIAIQQKRPLVLLPQTYGPFHSSACEKKASKIIKQAHCAWARDARSFEVLKSLLGSAFDANRHRCGVDVAFGLPAKLPDVLPIDLKKKLTSNIPKIGINVSGLIYNNFTKAKQQFGFKADYKQTILQLIQRFLTKTDCIIILVPHVITPKGHYESDMDACLDLTSRIKSQEGHERLFICPEYNNPCEVKWLISKLDWFCGTRMHATIAALSSGVPASAISYSPKTLGVFETCGQGEYVADPQQMDTFELAEHLWSSWQTKDNAKKYYTQNLPNVKLQVAAQIDYLFKLLQ
ncbi:MAG: polysaccharide pyruvyl transferase family protein [Deltaproteobacteria bacterium]|nr:polysaccharide pyruvyl transferase family protein [Deltaproteobacteria bacterium]